MEVTYIMTEDGKTKVEWWPKEKFRDRVTEVISSTHYDRIPIPNDSILCDFCNERIEEFPVPVVGTYALCRECLENIKRGESQMTTEARVITYVADDKLYYFNQHKVHKCLELTPDGCLQPTFPRRRKLEFQIGRITKEIAGGRGITCFESEATARHFMMKMRNNTGNLVVVRGIGYCFGDPPREHPEIKNRHSVLVRALKVEEILYSYNEIKKKGGETK